MSKQVTTAARLLNPEHPLHAVFVKSLDGKTATKRQARKYLANYPAWRNISCLLSDSRADRPMYAE